MLIILLFDNFAQVVSQNSLVSALIYFLCYSYVFLGTMGTCKTIAVVFYTLAWISYKPPVKEQQNNNENIEEPALQETSVTMTMTL